MSDIANGFKDWVETEFPIKEKSQREEDIKIHFVMRDYMWAEGSTTEILEFLLMEAFLLLYRLNTQLLDYMDMEDVMKHYGIKYKEVSMENDDGKEKRKSKK